MGIFVKSQSGTTSCVPKNETYWNRYTAYTNSLFQDIAIYVSDSFLFIASGQINSGRIVSNLGAPLISNLPVTEFSFYITLTSTQGINLFAQYNTLLHNNSEIVRRELDGDQIVPNVMYQISSVLAPLSTY